MICKNCRQYCPDGGRFCLYCGKPLEPDAPAVVTSDSVAEEPKRNSIKFSGTASESPKSTVKLSGGVPISQSNGSFQARRDPSPAPQPPTPVAPPAPRPTPVITPPTPDTPPKPQKKRSVGLILLLILLILSVCGLIGVLLYHFGVIGDKSTDETTAAQTEAAESISGNSNDDQTDPSTTEPEVRLRDGEVLLYGDPAPAMLYAAKMEETEELEYLYLYDIDGDGLCELILEYYCDFYFYTCRNDTLIYLGTFDSRCREPVLDGDRLLLQYTSEGHEEIYTVTLANDVLSVVLASERDLGEGESYTEYSALPLRSYGSDLSLLSNLYTQAQNQVVTPSEYFVEKDGYFTDGQCAYCLLSDGTLLGYDGVTGTSTAYGANFSENTFLFGVTENSFYFQYADPENWWGVTVYALDKSTLVRTNYGEGWEPKYREGYVLLKSFRSDVSPSFLRVIDNDDVTLVSDVFGFDLTVYDGQVYLLEVYEDLSVSPNTTTITEYRLDPGGLTEVALIAEGSYYAHYHEASIVVYDLSQEENNATYFDIPTGKPIS